MADKMPKMPIVSEGEVVVEWTDEQGNIYKNPDFVQNPTPAGPSQGIQSPLGVTTPAAQASQDVTEGQGLDPTASPFDPQSPCGSSEGSETQTRVSLDARMDLGKLEPPSTATAREALTAPRPDGSDKNPPDAEKAKRLASRPDVLNPQQRWSYEQTKRPDSDRSIQARVAKEKREGRYKPSQKPDGTYAGQSTGRNTMQQPPNRPFPGAWNQSVDATGRPIGNLPGMMPPSQAIPPPQQPVPQAYIAAQVAYPGQPIA